MKSLWLTSAVSALALVSFSAQAQSTAKKAKLPSNSSVASASITKAEKKPLPISANLSSTLFGPTANDIDGGKTADSAIDAEMGLFSRHTLGVKYSLMKDLSVAAVGEGDVQHTILPGSSEAKGFTMRDPYVKISKANLINTSIKGNALAVDSQVRMYAPLGKSSKAANTISKVSLFMNPTLNIGKSRFSISAANYARYFIQSKELHPKTNSPMTQMDFYTGPQLNYEVSDKISAFVLYEAEMTYDTLGRSETNYAPNNSKTDLEPGVSLQLGKAVNLTPFLNWYTNQRLSTTSVNLNASINLM